MPAFSSLDSREDALRARPMMVLEGFLDRSWRKAN